MARENTSTKKNTLETYFEWYLTELRDNGFIEHIIREPFPIVLSPGCTYERFNFDKAQPKLEKARLFNENKYMFDYLIVWTPRAKELFYNLLDTPVRIWCPFYAMIDSQGKHFSLVDVKPPSGAMMYNNNTSSYTFPIIQKMIYYMYSLYVTKAIPIPLVQKGEIKSGNKNSLFPTTFVPKRFHLTDGGAQGRNILYNKRTLQEYVLWKTKEIDKINSLFHVQGKLF